MSLEALAAEIAAETQAARERMRIYQLAALGALDTALVMLEVSPGTSRERLRANTESIKRNATSERERMLRVAQSVGVKAVEVLPSIDPKTAGGFSTEMGLYLGTTLENQVRDDALQVENVFGKIRLLVDQYEREGTATPQAIEKARKTAMATFRFRFVDARGQVRQVDDRVTTLVNGSLHKMANELALMGLLWLGETSATVHRPGHPTHGKVFALAQGFGDYFDLETDIFHPRSDALVSRSSVTAD